MFNDIYYKIETDLKNQKINIEKLSEQEQKAIIDSCLKNYLIDKLKEINVTNLDKEKTNLNTIELYKILASNIAIKDHANTLSDFIHYILQISSNFQQYQIIWYWDENESLIDHPVIEFKNGLWDCLISHKKTSYIKTFEFVYDAFKCKPLTLKTKQKIKR